MIYVILFKLWESHVAKNTFLVIHRMAIAAADFHLKTLLSLTFVSVLGVEALAALADLLM